MPSLQSPETHIRDRERFNFSPSRSSPQSDRWQHSLRDYGNTSNETSDPWQLQLRNHPSPKASPQSLTTLNDRLLKASSSANS